MKAASENLLVRVLVIDDMPSIHASFRQILCGSRFLTQHDETDLFASAVPRAKSFQFDLCSAMQGAEGVEIAAQAKREGRKFSLAFVDMRMPPGWDGIETTRRLWEIDPDLQIVICSAYLDYSWEEMIEQLGTSDRFIILKKPFDVIEVLQMAHVLAEKRTLLENVRHSLAHLEEIVAMRTKELAEAQSQLLADIGNRKKIEFELLKLLRAVEQSPTSIIITDITGNIEYVNPRFCALTGYTFDEMIGKIRAC